MRRWSLAAISLAVVVVWAAGPVEAAPCGPKLRRHCLAAPASLNFNTVPAISKQIVSDERAPEKPVTRTLEAPPITTYTGPTVGVNTMARAPTVGYYWSLDSQTDAH